GSRAGLSRGIPAISWRSSWRTDGVGRQVTEIVEFLRARLDEDEAVARKAIEGYRSGEWEMRYPPYAGSGVYVVGEEDGYVTCDQEGLSDSVGTDGIGRHIARHDPARVLREVGAKRAVL